MTLPDKGSRPLLSLSVSERDRRIAAEVETAFVSAEAGAGERGEGIPEASVDSELLQTVPAPPPLNFEKLEQEVSRQRRLVVRGAVGIPIAGVLAVGGSLLFHAILAGAFVASFWILLHAPRAGGGGGELLTDDGDRGGASHGGTLFISDVPAVAAGKEAPSSVAVAPSAKPAEVKEVPPAVVPPKPPIVASKPVPSPPEQIAMNVRPPLPNTPEIIGIPAPPDMLGVIHTRPPDLAPPIAPPPPAPPREVGLPIMAPPQTSIVSAPVRASGQTSPNGSPSATALRASSPRPGPDDGMGDDNDDEETISLLNPGHGGGVGGGDGAGSGRRRGNGIDRGPSGGDQETPSVLESPSFQLPAEYEYHPPKRRVTLAVTVLPNGRVGGILIKQSCGIAEVDEAYKSLVATQYKFRPAYRDGKTFTAVIDCSQSFGTDDE
jgi:hypothetical protein